MTKPLEQILQKEMSRKEFLATLGLGIVSVLGLSSVIKLLGGSSSHSPTRRSGYGSTSYGQ